MLLCAAVLLAGALIWGIFGHIDTQIAVYAEVENEKALCRVKSADIDAVHTGDILKIEKTEGVVTEIGEYDEASGTYTVFADIAAGDGYYTAYLVTERIRPLSFVLN